MHHIHLSLDAQSKQYQSLRNAYVYNTKDIILYIAITSPQKNDLCTQPKIDWVKRSFVMHYNCYYVMENLCTCCQPSDINTFKYSDICR